MQPLEIARTAAHAGGEIVRRYFHEGVTIRSKDAHNLVSDADVESEQMIVRIIQEAFPDHAILGEESHRDSVDSEHLWIVDPLPLHGMLLHASMYEIRIMPFAVALLCSLHFKCK